MARRSRGLGLTAFFNFTAFDIDTRAIGEGAGRAYLEHRLAQVDYWLDYMAGRVSARRRRRGSRPPFLPGRGSEALNDDLELVYLQSMRAALSDALENL